MGIIKIKTIKIISLFGIFGAIFYFIHIIFGRIFYEDYSPFSQAISDLTAQGSPSRQVSSIYSFLYGIFTVTFSVVFFIYFKGVINKFITIGSCIFCMMTIISFFGYTFFPLTESGYAGEFHDRMHVLITIFVVIFTIISIILYSIGFIKSKNYKYLGIISIFTFLLLVTGAMLINILPIEYFGIAQRINVYSLIIYTGILSLWMFYYVKNNGVRTNVA